MSEDTRAEFLTQKAAARLLGVSTSWLRSSGAPKLLIPGNGPVGQPLLRYSRAALLEWVGATRSRTRQDAPTSDRRGVKLATGGGE